MDCSPPLPSCMKWPGAKARQSPSEHMVANRPQGLSVPCLSASTPNATLWLLAVRRYTLCSTLDSLAKHGSRTEHTNCDTRMATLQLQDIKKGRLRYAFEVEIPTCMAHSDDAAVLYSRPVTRVSQAGHLLAHPVACCRQPFRHRRTCPVANSRLGTVLNISQVRCGLQKRDWILPRVRRSLECWVSPQLQHRLL